MSQQVASRSSTSGAPHRRGRRGPGWVPQQHGAWAMLASPFLTGMLATHPVWTHLPLLLTWFVGYFAFNAMSLWLKASRRARYWPPVRAYCLAAAVCGALTLALAPRLALWAPAFLPLVGIGLFEASRRRDRSLLSGLSTIVAAALMTFVVMAAAGPLNLARATYLTLAQLGYFVGVLLYVKTMIRERGHRAYVVASVLWHAAVTLAAAFSGHVWLAAVFVLLTARALLLPGKPLRPKQVGILEIPLHLLVVVVALLG